MSTTDGWLKLHFASCVIGQTRSLGALVLGSIRNMVFVNIISYDMDPQLHKFHGAPSFYIICKILQASLSEGCDTDDCSKVIILTKIWNKEG